MSVVNGKDIILSVNRDGIYRPVACNSVCSISFERDFLETTFRDSTNVRSFVPFKGTITLTGSGPIELADDFNASNVVDLWYSAELVQWKFELTDSKGHATITKTYTGYGYFRSVSITGDVQQAGSCDYEILVSNDITGVDVGLPGSGSTEFFEESYTAEEGQTVIGNGEWVGANMIEVLRNGVGLEIITGSTTSGEQVSFDSVAGTLTFGMALGAGEYIQVIWGS